jgi:hypothetical protein
MKISKHLYNIVFASFLLGCNYPTERSKDDEKTRPQDSVETNVRHEYSSDSLKIDIKNDNFNFSIFLTIGNFQQVYDLNKLHIPTKTPELVWVNKDYACILTWWSQADARYIFVPTKRTNKMIFIDKTIEASDSISNNIVYIDTVLTADRIIFKAENLLNRKKITFPLRISNKNDIYPFYDEMLLERNKLTITVGNEEKIIDIKEINN